MNTEPPLKKFRELLELFDLFLFDAYGVLIDGQAAFPGAVAALNLLSASDIPYFVLTNDASKDVTEAVNKYEGLGLTVDESHIISSGMLVSDYFVEHGLAGAKTIAIGPEKSLSFVRDAGGEVLPVTTDEVPEVLVILDDKIETPFHDYMENVITLLMRAVKRDAVPHLLLANPDLLYPSGKESFNFAAGSVANVLEEILALQFIGTSPPRFTRVGKPHLPIFEKVLKLAPGRNPIMIGDQLMTDIKGAKGAEIASALALTGVTNSEQARLAPESLKPDFLIADLSP